MRAPQFFSGVCLPGVLYRLRAAQAGENVVCGGGGAAVEMTHHLSSIF